MPYRTADVDVLLVLRRKEIFGLHRHCLAEPAVFLETEEILNRRCDTQRGNCKK